MKASSPITREFHLHKRNLPHWQTGGYTYFITFRSRIGILPDEAIERVKHHVLFDHMRRYELYFGVIMPDHVHLLLRPLPSGENTWHSLQKIMQGIKGSSSRSINMLLNRSGTVWQDEYFDRMIRDENELHEKWEYIYNNPVTAGLAGGGMEYPHYIKPPLTG